MLLILFGILQYFSTPFTRNVVYIFLFVCFFKNESAVTVCVGTESLCCRGSMLIISKAEFQVKGTDGKRRGGRMI